MKTNFINFLQGLDSSKSIRTKKTNKEKYTGLVNHLLRSLLYSLRVKIVFLDKAIRLENDLTA